MADRTAPTDSPNARPADRGTADRSDAASRDAALNPHGDEDRARASDVAYAQLRQRGVRVTGAESPDALAHVLEAVERFELAVSALGGDRMTNAPDSQQPDDRRLVMPARADDEDAGAYAARVREAAERLLRDAPPEMRRSEGRGAGDAVYGGLAADAQG